MIKVGMIKSCIYLILILITSCKYKLSTYSAMTPEQKLNGVYLKKIALQEAGEGANFKIAVFADTHNYYSELDKLINTINRRGPYSFVIICGDITNLGVLEEFDHARKFFNKLKYPYLVSVGNHDLLANGDDIFSNMFGASDFSFVYKDIEFVFFDNNNWENAGEVPDIRKISAILAASTASERVLVAHVPPDDPRRFTRSQITAWENLMTSENVSYFINGHNHNPGDKMFGSAVQITAGAPSKGKYYELIVGPGGITHQQVDF